MQGATLSARRPTDRGTLPGMLITAGGVILIVATVLPWYTASFAPGSGRELPQGGPGGTTAERIVQFLTGSVSVPGFRTTGGLLALAAGVLLLVAGVVIWVGTTARAGRALAVAAVVGAIAAAVVAVLPFTSSDSSLKTGLKVYVQDRAGDRVSPARIDQFVERLSPHIDQLGGSTSVQFGVFLALAGCAAGLLGGVVELVSAGGPGPAGPVESAADPGGPNPARPAPPPTPEPYPEPYLSGAGEGFGTDPEEGSTIEGEPTR